ncbi:enoyl-[acyl-carrier-protein] reductase, mitochondrial-like [Mizuhopecten yessoensis]|uniref:Enoyl-[acyl-carrier-protein] reductase, mitochondrial n=1 Tax=Mizuhopecten yessoensis TaxID=6573 RepID=A0A210PRP6_MIZYE|nr:enoyl-[acyl-carrier-protein] reductase, mitochondrial-like [Mizuhopecten yessoensis]OWF39165.1 Trans-2-enoyl-CoA reductase, mitochondrial [Mizuhopecten yessoensis]
MAALVKKIFRLRRSGVYFHRMIAFRKEICQARCFSYAKESIAITYSDFGDPRKVLRKEIIPMPTKLESSQILVKMLMAPINPSDINMIEGTYHIRPTLPSLVGNEGVGEVVDVGDGVKNLQKGDWVLPAHSAWGTWRTHALCEESSVEKVDNDIPVLGAATLAVNPCTAYRMLKDFFPVKQGDIVIQNGANSSVGQCVIQLAKEWGIHTVNIVRDRPDCNQLTNNLKDLGATHVVTEEFASSRGMRDFVASLPKAPVLALNCVGGRSATELTRFLGQNGVMVTYGGMSKKPVVVPTGAFIFKEIRLAGYWNTQWNTINSKSPEKLKMYKDLCDLIRAGKFLPPESDLTSIDKFEDAVAQAMEGFRKKKIVLVMDEKYF